MDSNMAVVKPILVKTYGEMIFFFLNPWSLDEYLQ
jgi:hypothetical protein